MHFLWESQDILNYGTTVKILRASSEMPSCCNVIVMCINRPVSPSPLFFVKLICINTSNRLQMASFSVKIFLKGMYLCPLNGFHANSASQVPMLNYNHPTLLKPPRLLAPKSNTVTVVILCCSSRTLYQNRQHLKWKSSSYQRIVLQQREGILLLYLHSTSQRFVKPSSLITDFFLTGPRYHSVPALHVCACVCVCVCPAACICVCQPHRLYSPQWLYVLIVVLHESKSYLSPLAKLSRSFSYRNRWERLPIKRQILSQH